MLAKEKTWKRIFNSNSELSQNRTEKQIMSTKTTINWLFKFQDFHRRNCITPCNRISIKHLLTTTGNFWNYCGQSLAGSGFPILGLGHGGVFPPSHDFICKHPIRFDDPMGHTPWLKNQSPHWKVKPLSRKWFLEKKFKKSGTFINTCVSLIKQNGERWQKFHKNGIILLGAFKAS